MIKHLAIVAALAMATPAWATCEPPAPKIPPTVQAQGDLAIITWTANFNAGYIQGCRKLEERDAVAQEREDIHAIRHALEGIEASAARIGQSR